MAYKDTVAYKNDVARRESAQAKIRAKLAANNSTSTTKSSAQIQKDIMQPAVDLVGGQFRSSQSGVRDTADELGLNITTATKTASSLEEYMKMLADERKKTAEEKIAQTGIQEGLDAATVQQNADQLRSQAAGTVASLAQGREGVISAGSPMVAKHATGYTESVIKQAQTSLDLANRQRAEYVKGLEEAVAQGNEDMIKNYREQIATADQTIRQETLAAAQGEQLAANTNKIKSETLQSNFEAMGEFAQNLDIGALTTMAENAGLSYGQTVAMRDMAVLTAKLGKAKSQGEVDQLTAQIAKLKKETEFVGKPADVQEFEYYRMLTPSQQNEYEKLKTIGNYQLVESEGKIYGYDKTNNKLSLLADQGEAINYDPEVFKIGQAVGWCGDYASSISTASTVGDSWSDKQNAIQDKNVSRGDKLLIPLGVDKNGKGYGHVAVVLNFDPVTGDIQVAESNKDGRQNRGEGLGVASFGVYNLNELNAKYGDNWGVAHGELRPEFANAEIGNTPSNDYDKYLNEYMSIGLSKDEAAKKAIDKVETDKVNQKAVESQVSQNQIAINTIDDILGQIGGVGAGTAIGRTLGSLIPGTTSTNIEANLDTVKAIVGFAKLQEMRNASKTGGALGQVSERENLLLQSVLGSLSVSQSTDQFIENLNKVKASIQAINDAAKQDYEGNDPYKILPESNIKSDPMGLFNK